MDDHLNFDPESPDAAELDGQELDLTPRVRDNEKRGSRTLPTVIIVGVLVVVGFVLFQGLSGATLSIQTADTAVAERSETGERRFRITGSPIAVTDEEIEVNGQTAVRFSIACDGAVVDVIHHGNVAEAFQTGVPVVLEGRWDDSGGIGSAWDSGANDGFVFTSDRMLVEHDNEYREDRVDEIASCGNADIADASGA